MEILNKYPELAEQFEEMYQTQRNKILTEMLEMDDEYKMLCKERMNSSMELKAVIVGSDIDVLFEKYSDAAFAQDVYELDALYKKGIEDALIVLERNGII